MNPGDRFYFQDEIGSGNFGTVYKVSDKEGNLFALKILKSPTTEDITAEFNRVKSIDSPYVIKYYELNPCFFEGSFTQCLLMQYFWGLPIIAYTSNPILTLEQLFLGLADIHDHGLVHGDLKPSNVLCNGIDVMIVDFGLSCQFNECNLLSGSLDYFAPEQLDPVRFHNNPEDARPRDIWAAGIIAFQVITGEYPFSLKNKRQLIKDIQNEPIPFELVPEKYRDLLQRILIRDASQRPTAKEILNFL